MNVSKHSSIEIEANRVIQSLVAAVPGDLGHLVRAMVGVENDARSRMLMDAPSVEYSAQFNSVRLDLLPNGSSGDSTHAKLSQPPASPIRWVWQMLTLCCEAYGQPIERAVPVGACLELLGIVSSVLDAAQDGHHDLMSQYCGTSVSLDGISANRLAALTTNAGVTLIGMAWHALFEYGPRYGIEALSLVEIGSLLSQHWVSICHAQHLDLTLGRSHHLTLDQYDQIVAGKAGGIGGVACEVAAILAGAHTHKDLWYTLGAERTIAQQLCDDYVDLREDLANGWQISHPVLYGLAVADPVQRDTILALLERARSDDAGAENIQQQLLCMLDEIGATYYTLACLAVRRKNALAALDALALPPNVYEQLCIWIWRVAPEYEHGQIE